jgi:hypothetical protein
MMVDIYASVKKNEVQQYRVVRVYCTIRGG